MYRAPDQIVPEEFLDICSAEKSDLIGGAIAFGGNLQTVNLDGSQLQTLKDTCKMEDYKPFGLLIHLSQEDTENTVSEDSQQPFIPYTCTDGSKLCACFIEGHYVGYDTTNTSNTVEYLVHQGYVVDKIKDVYASVGEDIDKLITKLRTPAMHREIVAGSGMGERGCIAFMFANGEIVLFTKGETQTNFTWGWSSQRFGWDKDMLNASTLGQQAGAAIQPAASAPKTMFSPPGAKTAPAVQAIPETAAASVVPGVGPQPDVTVPDKSNTAVLVYWPNSIEDGSNKNKKKWLGQYIGICPAGWADPKPGPWPLKSAHFHAIQSLVNGGKIILAGKPNAAPVAVPAKAVVAEGPKPVIIAADERRRFDNIFSPIILGTIDTAGQYVADPARIEAELGKQPSWLDQMGWPTKEMMEKGIPKGVDFWIRYNSTSFIEQFIRTDVPQATKVWQELVSELARTRKTLSEALKINKAA